MKLPKIFIALTAIACFAFAPKNDVRTFSVVLDAGHGGNDFGATIDDVTEKQITGQIVAKIQELNQNQDVKIEVTRVSDAQTSLDERTALINRVKPDLVLSLHVNANPDPGASGVEIYTPKAEAATSEQSNIFAQKLSGKLEQKLNMKVRSIKPAAFHILNKSASPALIVDLGYLTNAADRAFLTDSNSQAEIAGTILEFITDMK